MEHLAAFRPHVDSQCAHVPARCRGAAGDRGLDAAAERRRTGTTCNPLLNAVVDAPCPRGAVHRSLPINAWLIARHTDDDAILRIAALSPATGALAR